MGGPRSLLSVGLWQLNSNVSPKGANHQTNMSIAVVPPGNQEQDIINIDLAGLAARRADSKQVCVVREDGGDGIKIAAYSYCARQLACGDEHAEYGWRYASGYLWTLSMYGGSVLLGVAAMQAAFLAREYDGDGGPESSPFSKSANGSAVLQGSLDDALDESQRLHDRLGSLDWVPLLVYLGVGVQSICNLMHGIAYFLSAFETDHKVATEVSRMYGRLQELASTFRIDIGDIREPQGTAVGIVLLVTGFLLALGAVASVVAGGDWLFTGLVLAVVAGQIAATGFIEWADYYRIELTAYVHTIEEVSNECIHKEPALGESH